MSTRRQFTNTIYGIKIAGEQYGDGDRAVLLLHDLGLNRELYRPIARALRENGFCVYSIDLPGHGGSGKPYVDHTVMFMAEVILGFIEKRTLKNLLVAGHGFGASVAVELAAQRPSALRGIFMISPYGLDSSDPLQRDIGRTVSAAENSQRDRNTNLITRHLINGEDSAIHKEKLTQAMNLVPDHVLSSGLHCVVHWPASRMVRDCVPPMACVVGDKSLVEKSQLRSLSHEIGWAEAMFASHYGLALDAATAADTAQVCARFSSRLLA